MSNTDNQQARLEHALLERKIANLRLLQECSIAQRGMSVNEIRNQINECLERQQYLGQLIKQQAEVTPITLKPATP